MNSISPQVWIRVENNRLETLHKVMCGQMPQIFNLLEGNAVPQKKKVSWCQEGNKRSLMQKFINVRLKLAVFFSDDLEVFYSVCCEFHQMHLTGLTAEVISHVRLSQTWAWTWRWKRDSDWVHAPTRITDKCLQTGKKGT